MIDEGVLTELLAEAAASAPAASGIPDGSLHMATPAKPSRIRPRRRILVAVAAVAAFASAAVIAVELGGDSDRGTTRSASPQRPPFGLLEGDATSGAARRARAGSGGATGGAATGSGASGGATGSAGTGGGTSTLSGSTEAAAQSDPGPSAPSRALPPRIVKTGSVDVEVREGGFNGAVGRVIALATGLGGFVAESTTTESDDNPTGTITVRVPAESFEPLLAQVRELGNVEAVTSKGTDVTAEFTDLSARIAALATTRDRLFEVLRGARAIGDIIALHDRINGVQTEIEQLQGQQRVLEDKATFATLAVGLSEPHDEDEEPVPLSDEPDGDGLDEAWSEARRRFGDGIEGLVEWSGSAAVVAVVGVAILVVGRLGWRRARRHFV